MQPRTKRQKEVLDYIKHYIEKHGYEPSYQQIANNLNLSSKAGIAKHIEALENQGLIARIRENGIFKLEINPDKSILDLVCEIEWLNLPRDENNIENWEKTSLFVPKLLLGYNSPEMIKAFRVTEDAMNEVNINEGDIALIKARSYARDGDIVVALTENENYILRQYFRVGANIELHPANKKYETVIITADKIEIKGIYRGLLRPLA